MIIEAVPDALSDGNLEAALIMGKPLAANSFGFIYIAIYIFSLVGLVRGTGANWTLWTG